MYEHNLKRYSLSHQVADSLEKMIEKGDYAIGTKIPTEIELMQMFNVSRNTIREAIKALSSAGMLDVRQGDGTYVKSSNRFDAGMTKKYDEGSQSDIKEARLALEVSIVFFAALRRTDEDLNEIRQALIEDVDAESDVNFHKAIAKASHSKILYDLYISIYSYIESQIKEKHEDEAVDMELSNRLHKELFDAILYKDAEKAKKIAKQILDL